MNNVVVKLCPECKTEFRKVDHFVCHFLMEHRIYIDNVFNTHENGCNFKIHLHDGSVITEETLETKTFEELRKVEIDDFKIKDSTIDKSGAIVTFVEFVDKIPLENSEQAKIDSTDKSKIDIALSMKPNGPSNSKKMSSFVKKVSSSSTSKKISPSSPSKKLSSSSIFKIVSAPYASKKFSTMSSSTEISVDKTPLSPKKKKRDIVMKCQFCGKAFRSYVSVVRHEVEADHVSSDQVEKRNCFYRLLYPSKLRDNAN